MCMGLPSIEAEEAASEWMTHLRLASLPGHLPFRVIDRIHDSKVTYEIKKAIKKEKAEWETTWEWSYGSNRLINVVIW